MTLGEVGSVISVAKDFVLDHSMGLAWPPAPPPPLAADFFRWRLVGSEGRAGPQMGLGMRVRWARDGKHTRRSVEGACLVSLGFMLMFMVW